MTQPKRKATKTSTHEWTIPTDSGGTVRVVAKAPNITVFWTCGGSRTFTAADLTERLADVDTLGLTYDMWLVMPDSSKNGFAVHVGDGKFTANDPDHYVPSATIDWNEFRTALVAAIGDATS